MKKLLALTLALTLCLGLLAACAKKDPAPTTGGEEKPSVIKVAATPAPHADILAIAKEVLAEEGITLEIIEMNDYRQPNFITDSGEVLANYFQHITYMNTFNEEDKTNLVSVGAIHYEPYGLYPGKTATIDALTPGAQIAITNDTSNQARALMLLQEQGLIKLADGIGMNATPLDIVENKLELKFVEMEAAQLPSALSSVDMAVINGNYAIGAGLSVKDDAIAAEDAASEATELYANVLVVKAGNENDPGVMALLKALTSEKVKTYIESAYDGSVMPLF